MISIDYQNRAKEVLYSIWSRDFLCEECVISNIKIITKESLSFCFTPFDEIIVNVNERNERMFKDIKPPFYISIRRITIENNTSIELVIDLNRQNDSFGRNESLLFNGQIVDGKIYPHWRFVGRFKIPQAFLEYPIIKDMIKNANSILDKTRDFDDTIKIF